MIKKCNTIFEPFPLLVSYTADSSVCPRVEKQKEKDPQTSKWDFKSNLWANLSALSQESQTLFLTHRDEHFEVSVFNEIVP